MLNFGERLRALRKERGISQADLAQALGISERALQNYETGERDPKLGLVKTCANYFGVNAGYLMGDSVELKKPASITPEEAEFIRWVEDNVSDVFFYEFDKSPEESKEQLMKDLRYMWEREKKLRGEK